MSRQRVYVITDCTAFGLVPLAFYRGGGYAMRIKQILETRHEGANGTVYLCATWDGNVNLRRAYETGYWFLE